MPYALGGAKLSGDRLVRVTYVDESGTNPREPFMVVAGVVLDGDKQLSSVEDDLIALVAEYIPPEDREGFNLHAADIWNGWGYFKGKDDLWPEAKRRAILTDLVSLLPKYGIPVTCGIAHRETLAASMPRETTKEEWRAVVHSHAFIAMSVTLERAFRTLWPSENTLLIVEDHQEMRETLKQVQAMLRNPAKVKEWKLDTDVVPFRRIRDAPHFAAKEDSLCLQLADACAYSLRGCFNGNPLHQPLHDAIAPLLVAYPKMVEAHHTRAMRSASAKMIFDPWGYE